MSLKPKTYATVEEKCRRVLTCCGRAIISMADMDDAELDRLAALCDVDGVLVDGAQEKCRLLLVRHANKRAFDKRAAEKQTTTVTEG
jgi:hypothetical protein